jgi:DNA-binding NtrC family response regulator
MQATNHIIPSIDSEPMTALIAEDEVLIRMNLSDFLREAGFHVLEAANGEEARKIIMAVDHVDLVISDVHMLTPGEGFELARWMGEHYPTIPVILTSGSRGAQASEAWNTMSNVTDFVPKPYSRQDMERLARSRARAGHASSI